MSALRRVLVATGAIALATTLAPRAAHADERQACLAASEKAQQLRNAGKLGEAREQLAICGRAECPKLVQQDCSEWMREVLASLPSVVPGAKDKSGRDLVDVRVTIDGKVVTETLDGKPIALDPGVHTVRFETKGASPVEEQVVIRQGEKNRILTVTIATGGDATPAPSPAPPPRPVDATPSGKGVPWLAYTLAGAGLAAGAVALVVDLGASSDARELRRTCAPTCDQAAVDDIDGRYTVAGITAGVGGALFVTGVVLFVLHVTSDAPARSGAWLAPSRGGATVGLRF